MAKKYAGGLQQHVGRAAPLGRRRHGIVAIHGVLVLPAMGGAHEPMRPRKPWGGAACAAQPTGSPQVVDAARAMRLAQAMWSE